MASQSLYRKWRSQTFADLVGQEAVVRTLLNAVRDGRLAHAYLFCGPRGTGKTSSARLLAKAVNCANPHDGEPCNECLSCREIASGTSPDVIEIDAASNNGVEDIRSLRETVNLLGSGGRHKLYIIDEAHMLSTQAWNALLKTLEEPPPHIIFVFATTEAHKVLPTIVSRCQRFDFRRISTRDIIAHLQHVAAAEGLALEPAAAELLARAAQGGMRDALSLLDQAMAYCGTEIPADRVREMLGLADAGLLRQLIADVAEQDAAAGLARLNDLVTSGADLRQLNSQLAEEWRALVLARAGADVARLTDRTDEEARDIAALAARFSLDELTACARVFARNEAPARGLPVPQLALELSFLECVGIKARSGLPAVQQPMVGAPSSAGARTGAPGVTPAGTGIAATLSNGAPTAGGARPAAPGAAASDTGVPMPEVTRRGAGPTPAPPPSVGARPAAPASHEVEELDLAAIDRGDLLPSVRPSSNGATARPAEPPQPAGSTVGAQPAAAAVTDDAPAAVDDGAPPDDAPWPEDPQLAPEGDLIGTLAQAQNQWTLVIQVCKQKSRSAAALLNNARPIMIEPGETPVIVLQADFEFHHAKLREPNQRGAVEWALQQVLERPVRVKLVLAGQGGGGAPGGPGSSPSGGAGPSISGNGNGGRNGGSGPSLRPAAPAPQAARPSAATAAAADVASVAVRDAAAPYTVATNGSAPATATRPASRRNPDIRPVRPLEEEVRADAVVQTLIRSYGVELADVRSLDDDE